MLALLYDVHGNLAALEAVLDDARERGAERYLIGGDVALFGAWPLETVRRLDELAPATWIRGNGERWTADPAGAPRGEPVQGAIAAARAALGDELVARLATLPESAVLDERTRAWHGSPVSDVRSFMPVPAGDEPELLDGVRDGRLVFGHTHLPFARRAAGGIELFNPGSVGMPFDGDQRAAYGLLAPDGTLEHVRVAYDHAQTIRALRERNGGAPWAGIVQVRLDRASLG